MEPKERCDVAVTMPAAAAAPACARNAVARWLRGRVLDAVLDDAVLLVSELVTNSARHAIAPSGATISVRGTLDDRVVRVHVLDEGRHGAVTARDPGEDGCGGHGGYGLQLVASLAADWGVRRDRGTEVWFELPAAGANANRGRARPADTLPQVAAAD